MKIRGGREGISSHTFVYFTRNFFSLFAMIAFRVFFSAFNLSRRKGEKCLLQFVFKKKVCPSENEEEARRISGEGRIGHEMVGWDVAEQSSFCALGLVPHRELFCP